MSLYMTELEGDDVSIVIYSQEFATEKLGITKEDVEKYGPPRALKYKNCEILIPIPSYRSVRKLITKMESNNTDNLSDEEISMKIAENFFK